MSNNKWLCEAPNKNHTNERCKAKKKKKNIKKILKKIEENALYKTPDDCKGFTTIDDYNCTATITTNFRAIDVDNAMVKYQECLQRMGIQHTKICISIQRENGQLKICKEICKNS